MSIENFPVPGAYNTRGGLAVYGLGTDGNVIITGTVVLNRDMYYNNLTVMGGAQLDTNGYRVFVKDTLNMADASSVIGRLSDKTSVGSILGGAPSGIKASDTLGGDGGLNPGENFFGEAEFYNFSQAIAGYKFDAVAGTLKFLMGGSGGASGTFGASGSTGSFTLGSPGTSGSTGALGTRPGFETTIGASGGQGYTGTSGSSGTSGVGGGGGLGGSGGLGGAGGGVVIISARNIVGLGIIRADGESGEPGNPGFPGTSGTPGESGIPGVPGQPAPDFFSASYTYISQAAYNYNVLYSFVNPTTGGNPRTTYNTPFFVYNYYYYGSPVTLYNRPTFTTVYNRPTTTYNSPVTTYNRPTAGTFNPPNTPGPASVRWRTPSRQNAPTPGTPRTTAGTARTVSGNSFNTNVLGTAYTVVSYEFIENIATPAPGNPRTTYNAIISGNTSYAYNTASEPDVFDIEPAQYFVGGAGGEGGFGGTGGIGSAGLPGSPGTAGYVGGGGVVLIITENNIPIGIEVRAAAGTGDLGMATSGTVVIIKNEAVKDGN